MWKPVFIYPFLFAIFPILSLFSHNMSKVSFPEILVPTGIVMCSAALLILLSLMFLRNKEKAAVLVSSFLVLFFSYGHVWNVTHEIAGIVIVRHTYLLPTWIFLFTCTTYFIIKTHRDLRTLTNILTPVGAFLVLIPLTNIVVYRLTTPSASWNIETTEKINTTNSENPTNLPDIYYIILDRYPSTATLREFYAFDNNEFVHYLSDRGFHVASESISNYLFTAPSLASSLNMRYINYLRKKVGDESDNMLPIYAMLQEYSVWKFLKLKGYKFVHFGSWWEPTRKNKYADVNINFCALPEFLIKLYNSTMLYPIAAKLRIFDQRFIQWKRVLYKLDKLAEIPNAEEPTYVFAHMLIPHEPYVFDRDGNFLPQTEEEKRGRIVNFLDQLAFINKKIQLLIDRLLASSRVSPIIILQADEGPYPMRYRHEGDKFNWKRATRAELREKMRIFNAYYLPGLDKKLLYPSITPVNSFRLIFNHYFNSNFELLPDRSYVELEPNHPYKFLDVTDKLLFSRSHFPPD